MLRNNYSLPNRTFGDLEKFYIDPKTEIDTSKMLSQGGSGLVQMKAEEREMILCILSQMIRYQHSTCNSTPVVLRSILCSVTNTYCIAMYMDLHTPYSYLSSIVEVNDIIERSMGG